MSLARQNEAHIHIVEGVIDNMGRPAGCTLYSMNTISLPRGGRLVVFFSGRPHEPCNVTVVVRYGARGGHILLPVLHLEGEKVARVHNKYINKRRFIPAQKLVKDFLYGIATEISIL
jgi:hypothetical protein